MLRLGFDWDGEGARPIQEATWKRAVEFLSSQDRWFRSSAGRAVPVPDITPVPDGSIDLHWDRPEFELLINIPADPAAPANFYGDDRGRLSIKGTLDTTRLNQGLVQWLSQL